MYFLTASNLNLVDMGWASSMIITLVELKSKQKLLSLMNWSFWLIFWPRPTSTQWTWGFDSKYWIGLGASQHACGQKQPSILQKLEVRESFPTFVKWMVTRFYPPIQKLLNQVFSFPPFQGFVQWKNQLKTEKSADFITDS